MDLVSAVSDKEFDDTLEDIGGKALFDTRKTKLDKEFSWLDQADSKDWEHLAYRYFEYVKEPIFVRFVDPCNPRFGSIARLKTRPNNNYGYSYYSNIKPHTPAEQAKQAANLAIQKTIYTELNWDKRNSKPGFNTYSDFVEYLPGYTGDTVWKFDRERAKRIHAKPAYDRLDREIQVGDFCTYILYQFDGRGAAGIYFGNVTKIDKDGQVYCKNVSLKSGERVAEKPIKDNNLITILTDDLMRQLMLAKLSA